MASPGPTAAPPVPCSRSAIRGPPATTTMNTPCIRPRISSVAAVWRIALRNTMLIMSAAPPMARNTTASHSASARPNPTMATPHATIETTTPMPCRVTLDVHPDVRPHSIAPSGIAANSQPSARPPPGGSPNVFSAISGNSARGMPKTIAMMSSRKLASRIFWSARYRKPSTTSRRPARRLLPSSGGRGGSFQTAQMVAVSATASTRYRVESPTTGMSAPASIGPNTPPNIITVDDSAEAAGICSAGTSRATDAVRAGAFTAKNTCCRPSSAITSHTESAFTAAWSHSSTDVTAMPALVTTSSLRRSTTSAMAPP